MTPDPVALSPAHAPRQGRLLRSSKQRDFLDRFESTVVRGEDEYPLDEWERLRLLLYRLRWHQRKTARELAAMARVDKKTMESWYQDFRVRRRDPAPEGLQ